MKNAAGRLATAMALLFGLGGGILLRASAQGPEEQAMPAGGMQAKAMNAQGAGYAGHSPAASEPAGALQDPGVLDMGSMASQGSPAEGSQAGTAEQTESAAQGSPAASSGIAPDGIAINLANPECPIMGGDTDGTVFTHWKGLRVQFCCLGCEEDFLREPEEHLEELGVEYTAALVAMRTYEAASEDERRALLIDMRKRFDVVEPAAPAEDNKR